MKWKKQLTDYLTYSNSKPSALSESNEYLMTKAHRVLMSATTIDQVKIALRYCRLAKATNLEAYKIWNDFITIVEDK